MGVQVSCPQCRNVWHVRALAQEQQSRCRACGAVVAVPPHETRTSTQRNHWTGERVHRTRTVPIRSSWWAWLIVAGCAWWLLGAIPEPVLAILGGLMGIGIAVWFMVPRR